MQLNDPSLFREQCYLDGAWADADDGARLEVDNPADGSRLGTVPRMGAAETRRAIEAAARALAPWRALTGKQRAGHLRDWSDRILEHGEDLARLLTAEQGKPLAESRDEVAYAASHVEWFSEEAKRIYGDTIPGHLPDKRIMVLKEPVGVVAAITPWNFPLAMVARKLAPALAAGCTAVAKPASQTPFSALALARLAESAGIPGGVINLVTGDAQAIGGELTASPVVRMLSFTGSGPTGKHLMRQCAGTVKKMLIELGGNAPFIVFEDADIDAAVAGAVQAKFRNSGQTCVCANRILVQDAVHDAFTGKLARAVSRLTLGDGLAEGTDIGPLIDSRAIEKVEDHLRDAVSCGARVLTGGQREARPGNFFAPTVLEGVTPAMAVSREETFGPLAPVYRFETDEDAMRLANDTEAGLAAYFYTRDLTRAWRIAECLEYGIVGINTGLISTEVAPFGGIKASGFGREGSRYGIEEFLEIKYVCIGGIDR
ncbi:MAG: NAD-dependent succinate-semialdehyde dehydrogenase [Gammaproteobacteria bacterium]|nr:NAD-dependent succinate-semialdehyde dehydrogenase [Gammaproteobacteria bacterium]